MKKRLCPKNRVLVRAFLSELGPTKKAALINHVSVCPACDEKFKMLLQLQRELRKQESEIPIESVMPIKAKELRRMAKEKVKKLSREEKARLFGLFPIRPITAAALLIFIAAGFLFFITLGQKETLRNGHQGELRLIKPEGKIKRPPSVFVWTPVADAKSYRFQLIDDELHTLCSENIHEARMCLSPEIQKKMQRGKTYIWTVEAYDDSQNRLDSEVLSFELK